MKNIKRKNFIVMLGASALGVYSLLRSPWEIFRSKALSASQDKKFSGAVKFKENPHSIKRQNNS